MLGMYEDYDKDLLVTDGVDYLFWLVGRDDWPFFSKWGFHKALYGSEVPRLSKFLLPKEFIQDD